MRRDAETSLPACLRWRLVGDGAVLDHQFNTTDVAVVVKTDQVTDKYYRHYERKVREG